MLQMPFEVQMVYYIWTLQTETARIRLLGLERTVQRHSDWPTNEKSPLKSTLTIKEFDCFLNSSAISNITGQEFN